MANGGIIGEDVDFSNCTLKTNWEVVGIFHQHSYTGNENLSIRLNNMKVLEQG